MSAQGFYPLSPPPPNNLREIRENLGVTMVELSRAAAVSEKTISRVELRKANFRMITYSRILNALNTFHKKGGLRELSMQDVFPHGLR